MPIELSADERAAIRRKVHRLVRHVSDPAKRARMIVTLTKQLTTLALIDAIEREIEK